MHTHCKFVLPTIVALVLAGCAPQCRLAPCGSVMREACMGFPGPVCFGCKCCAWVKPRVRPCMRCPEALRLPCVPCARPTAHYFGFGHAQGHLDADADAVQSNAEAVSDEEMSEEVDAMSEAIDDAMRDATTDAMTDESAGDLESSDDAAPSDFPADEEESPVELPESP